MKALIGVVVSDKMAKTVVVETTREFKHPLYKKAMKRTSRIKARNEQSVKIGDVVMIESTAPFSKETHYKVVKVITEKNKGTTV